jgi:hypothetical protein
MEHPRMHSWDYVRAYYRVNRETYELGRWRALVGAWRLWWMIRPIVKEG